MRDRLVILYGGVSVDNRSFLLCGRGNIPQNILLNSTPNEVGSSRLQQAELWAIRTLLGVYPSVGVL